MFAVMKRNWWMYKRYFPIIHFLDRIFSYVCIILGLWLMHFFLFKGMIKTEVHAQIGDIDYFTYAAVGVIFENMTVSLLMNVSRSLITEVREGTLQSLIITPYNILKYYTGVLVEQIWRMLLEASILVVISSLLGAKMFEISWQYWLVIIPLLILTSFSMGIILSNIMLQTRDTYISQNLLFSMIFFACGITFPITLLPDGVQIISYLFPITQVLEIFRIVSFMPEQSSSIPNLLISSLGMSIFYLFLGLKLYKYTERKTIEYIFE